MAPPLNIRCEARLNVVRAFEQIGLQLFAEPGDCMFVWARFRHIEDSLALAEASQRDGIMLAPGTVFRPRLDRFSVDEIQCRRMRGHARAALVPATDHPATTAPMADPEISRFPRKERPYMPGSKTTPGPAGARSDAPASVAFRGVNNVGTRVSGLTIVT